MPALAKELCLELSAWRSYRQADFPACSWTAEGDALRALAKGPRVDLVSRQRFADFDLSFEWRVPVGGNSARVLACDPASEEFRRARREGGRMTPDDQDGGAEKRKAQFAFTVGYGLLWGALYALARRRLPLATSLFGLPAVVFYPACDGFLAPLLRMSPGVQRMPWQFNAKELANHVAWTETAEAVHRGAEKLE